MISKVLIASLLSFLLTACANLAIDDNPDIWSQIDRDAQGGGN